MADFDSKAEQMILQLYDRVEFKRKPGKAVTFSEDEKLKIKLKWDNWTAGNFNVRGLESFQRLFEKHPETVKVFDFMKDTTMEQMHYNSMIFLHVTKVMEYLNDVMRHLGNLEEIVPKLRQLGGRHGHKAGGHKVPGSYFPWLGIVMKELMQEHDGEWTEVHESAWAKFFSFVVDQLVSGQKVHGGGSEFFAEQAINSGDGTQDGGEN